MKLAFSAFSTMLLLCAVTLSARAQDASGEQQFRSIYKELIETNTTTSSGSCTRAAEAMAKRLEAGGLPDSQVRLLMPPEYPLDGNLVAIYPGTDPRFKPLLLLAHLDVVEARREDWTRDPFKLIEEHGNFYARGALDDKAEAAIWIDTLLRFREEHYRPRRTVKVALTCGEESGSRINGVHWLLDTDRKLLEAAFAINEGGMGELDAHGRKIALDVEAAEKTAQNYLLEVTDPGGHSSRPRKDNAIYSLAGALKKIEAYQFDAQFNAANHAYFEGMSKIEERQGEYELAKQMQALANEPSDATAIAAVSAASPAWNAALRTTCVATTIDGGHAQNALPQRARANVNCRLFPGATPDMVHAQLTTVIDDPAVQISTLPIHHPPAPSPPLTQEIMEPIVRLAAARWPGIPVLPTLEAYGTDGTLLNAAGIPTYGIQPIFVGEDLGNMHGLNEHVGVRELLEGREFLYRLIKSYASPH